MDRPTGRVLRLLVAVATLCWWLSSCLMYAAEEFLPGQDAEALALPAQSSPARMPLARDPPAGAVAGGANDRVQLADIPAAPQPHHTVRRATRGNGELDFGTVALRDGGRSPLHGSPGPSARQTTGWYLKWQR